MEHFGSYFRELRNTFWVKILKFFDAGPGIFKTLDPGSGMEKILIRDKHPGSATLLCWYCLIIESNDESDFSKETRKVRIVYMKLYIFAKVATTPAST